MKQLRIRDLHHSYGLTQVLAGVTLALDSGQVLALVGPSGCGKSTLLHIVAGLLTPSEMEMTSSFENVCCMFQEPRLMPWKTACDNIALGLKAMHIAKEPRRKRAVELGLRMGLSEEDLQKFPHELSGGMQSRVSLARALAPRPDLLLLDEPFGALDVGLKEEMYRLLSDQLARDNAAVLMITHDLMEAVRLADRVVMMVPEPGRLAGEFVIDRPHPRRTSTWVHQKTARLMLEDVVRVGFGLGHPDPSGDLH